MREQYSVVMSVSFTGSKGPRYLVKFKFESLVGDRDAGISVSSVNFSYNNESPWPEKKCAMPPLPAKKRWSRFEFGMFRTPLLRKRGSHFFRGIKFLEMILSPPRAYAPTLA